MTFNAGRPFVILLGLFSHRSHLPSLKQRPLVPIRKFNRRLISRCLLVVAVLSVGGCLAGKPNADLLPGNEKIVRDQLVIRSNFHVPSRHRLIDELVARRDDIAGILSLPMSDELINVYLFEDATKFKRFMETEHPDFSDRRAFFVKNDTELKIYAHWGEKVGEDLRHEITHGYLHSAVPNMELWMDEGLAEYFEVPRGKKGINDSHVYTLSDRYRQSDWLPDVERLDGIRHPQDLKQIDYAESWLWIHYLLQDSEATRKLVQDHLARLRLSGDDEPLSRQIKRLLPNVEVRVVEHLKRLAEQQ